MSEAGPPLRSRRLWAERESMCLTILDRALLLLRLNQDLPETEVELNRRLYLCLLRPIVSCIPRTTFLRHWSAITSPTRMMKLE